MRKTTSAKIRRFVAQRADYRCEYCRFREDDLFLSFEVDHIISVKHGGGRIGLATVKLLRFNEADRLILRQLLMQAGRYP